MRCSDYRRHHSPRLSWGFGLRFSFGRSGRSRRRVDVVPTAACQGYLSRTTMTVVKSCSPNSSIIRSRSTSPSLFQSLESTMASINSKFLHHHVCTQYPGYVWHIGWVHCADARILSLRSGVWVCLGENEFVHNMAPSMHMPHHTTKSQVLYQGTLPCPLEPTVMLSTTGVIYLWHTGVRCRSRSSKVCDVVLVEGVFHKGCDSVKPGLYS